VGKKLGMNPQIGMPSYCRLGRKPFFSRVVDLFKFIDDYVKVCYARTA
jgi:hypothetical protein